MLRPPRRGVATLPLPAAAVAVILSPPPRRRSMGQPPLLRQPLARGAFALAIALLQHAPAALHAAPGPTGIPATAATAAGAGAPREAAARADQAAPEPAAAGTERQLEPEPEQPPQRQSQQQPQPPPPSPPLEELDLAPAWLSGQRWLRLPAWLELEGTFTAEPMANPVGGVRQGAGWLGQVNLALTAGRGLARPLHTWRELDHWSLAAAFTHTGGNDLYSAEIGALFPLQQIAYPPGLLLSEASLNRNNGEGWLSFKGGIVPLNPSFVSAPVFSSYVHSAFNDTLNLSLPGLPMSPYPAFGAIVGLHPSPELVLRAGWFDLASTQPLANWLGSQAPFASSPGGSVQLLQLSWQPAALAPPPDTPLRGCRTAAGVVRLRGDCRQPVAVANQLPGALLNLGGYGTSLQGGGLYGSATLRSGLPLGLDERLWLGGAWAPDSSGSIGPRFLAAGLLVQGALPGRPLDLLVLGAGWAGLNRQLSDGTGTASGMEAMLELGYQLQINRGLALHPSLQWIINPSAAGRPVPGILAAGLQLTLSF